VVKTVVGLGSIIVVGIFMILVGIGTFIEGARVYSSHKISLKDFETVLVHSGAFFLFRVLPVIIFLTGVYLAIMPIVIVIIYGV